MSRTEIKLRLVLSAVLCAAAAAAAVQATSFRSVSSYTPLLAGSLATAVFGSIVVRETVRLRRTADQEYTRSVEHIDSGPLSFAAVRAGAKYALVVVAFLVLTWLVGLMVAGPVFVAVFLLADARARMRFCLVGGVATYVGLWVLARLVELRWPDGILFG